MDIKKYIASGILEQYVLGLVSEKDRQEIEQYMTQYPEIKKEIDSIEKAMELYAEGSKMTPSASLEQSILEAIEQTPQDLPPALIAPTVPPTATTSWLTYLLAALLIAALALAAWFYNQHQQTQQELDTQQNNFQQLQQDCNEKDDTIEQLNNDIDVMLDPDNRKPLNNTDGQTLAAVFYDADAKKAYLNVGSLPEPPANRKYELWGLVEGQPVSMGAFVISADGDTSLIEVPFVENATVFAVTFEPLDNDPEPNLAELQVISS